MSKDRLQRFIFEQVDVRGQWVNLADTYREVLAGHQYQPVVARLLGEFLAACVLISANLKFEGRISLQARSAGALAMIMAEATHDMTVRGIAQADGVIGDLPFDQMLSGGTLAITVEPRDGQRYQGVVPLVGASLGQCLQAYFDQSEQLPSRFWLAADGEQAAGLMLQALPEQLITESERREEQWRHLVLLADTVDSEELLALDGETLLYRLYHQDPLRLLADQGVRFQCTCSRERTSQVLLSMGWPEVESILKEDGVITMDCQFCHRHYRFEGDEIHRLFERPGGSTLH